MNIVIFFLLKYNDVHVIEIYYNNYQLWTVNSSAYVVKFQILLFGMVWNKDRQQNFTCKQNFCFPMVQSLFPLQNFLLSTRFLP